jgi:hypothetical protein
MQVKEGKLGEDEFREDLRAVGGPMDMALPLRDAGTCRSYLDAVRVFGLDGLSRHHTAGLPGGVDLGSDPGEAS